MKTFQEYLETVQGEVIQEGIFGKKKDGLKGPEGTHEELEDKASEISGKLDDILEKVGPKGINFKEGPGVEEQKGKVIKNKEGKLELKSMMCYILLPDFSNKHFDHDKNAIAQEKISKQAVEQAMNKIKDIDGVEIKYKITTRSAYVKMQD